ncbi:MAG: EAL domain-containing protein, partial [Ruminococcus sp.]|nr:EAL domain-containing protein [Ruminococcus sp.]
MGAKRRSENFYSIEYGVLYLDLSEFKTVRCDEAFCALSGYSAQEVEGGLPVETFVDSDTADAVRSLAESGGEVGDVMCFEHCMKCKTGETISVTDFVWINREGGSRQAILYVNKPIGALLRNIDIYEMTSHGLFDTIFSGIPGAVAIYETDWETVRVFKASENYYQLLGFKDVADYNRLVGECLSKSANQIMFGRMRECTETGKTVKSEYQTPHPDGTLHWLEAKIKPFFERDGKQYFFVIMSDVTKSKNQENEIKRQNKRFEIIAKTTNDIYFDYDIIHDIFYLPNNDNYISRYDNVVENYFTDRKFARYMMEEDAQQFEDKLLSARDKLVSGTIEYRTKAFDDDYAWYKISYTTVADENGNITNAYGRISSIETEQMLKRRIDSDKKLIERLSERDLITGLYNRHTFKEKASKYIEGISDGRCYAIVYSDINDFSYVNENFGYDAGNRMLSDFAKVISESEGVVYSCRIYSDFYTTLYVADSRDKLIKAVNKRNQDFAQLQKEYYPASNINVSSGMYFIPNKDTDITIAMDNANLARRSIKGSDDVLCGIYSERMRKERLRDQSIASEVKNAMDQGMIELFLQPKFDLVTRQIIGAEALARWKNHDGSYKMPYEFIPVLERVGLIIEFDFFMYEQVLKTYVKWKNEGRRLIPISVNFSRVHSSKENFVDRVNSLADRYGVEKGLIEIEITESAFVEDVNIMIRYMSKLREYGFKIDIDDFGIGYSSLSVLLNAPVDIVKVEKVFIDNIATNLLEREYVKQIC